MNAPIRPLATCPLCRAVIEYWPPNHPLQDCRQCMRPLALIPAFRRRMKAYRIVSVYAIGKNVTALVALAALLSISTNLLHLRLLATLAVSAFLVRGALEIADGLAGYKSRIDFSWNEMKIDMTARRYSVAKIALGSCLLALGLVGIGAQL